MFPVAPASSVFVQECRRASHDLQRTLQDVRIQVKTRRVSTYNRDPEEFRLLDEAVCVAHDLDIGLHPVTLKSSLLDEAVCADQDLDIGLRPRPRDPSFGLSISTQ